MAAILETDNCVIEKRIREARAAIKQRLSGYIDIGSDEEREMNEAQNALRILETERVLNSS
jgi:hypothetical protein